MDKPTVYINNNGAVSGTKIVKQILLEAYLQQQEFTLTFVGVECFLVQRFYSLRSAKAVLLRLLYFPLFFIVCKH